MHSHVHKIRFRGDQGKKLLWQAPPVLKCALHSHGIFYSFYTGGLHQHSERKRRNSGSGLKPTVGQSETSPDSRELLHRLPCKSITKWAPGFLTLHPALCKTLMLILTTWSLHQESNAGPLISIPFLIAWADILSMVYVFCVSISINELDKSLKAGSAMISPKKNW